MINFNKKELVVEVTEYFTWDHVKKYFGTIVTDICQWEDDEKGDDTDAIDIFLEECNTELTDEAKAEIMDCIIDYWDCCNDEFSTLWDSEVIREGIFMWIEDNYHFDARYDDLTNIW